MKKFALSALLLMSAATIAAAQDSTAAHKSVMQTAVRIFPANFKTDGCTLFPDGDYRECCVAHDLAYFSGGSWRERLRADNRLFKCVARKQGWWHKPVAAIMWTGVRVGGVSFLPTPFRWGFGRKKMKTTD